MIGAILLTGLFSNLAVALEDANEQVAPADGDKAIDALPPAEQAEFVGLVEAAQVDAMKDAVTWTAGFVLLGILVATFLPGNRKEEERPEPEPRALLK